MSRRGEIARTGIALAVVAVLIALGWLNRDRFAPPEAGEPAPAFELPKLGGGSVRLADYRGSIVVLNFWATWCPPCLREMPSLERLHRKLGAEGLVVVGLNVDAPIGGLDSSGNPGGDVAGFVRRTGVTFTTLLDPRGTVLDRYKVIGLPTTLVLDREGRIVSKTIGPAEWDDAAHVARLRDLLGG